MMFVRITKGKQEKEMGDVKGTQLRENISW